MADALVAVFALCVMVLCLCCMSSCSSILANNCTKGTLDGDDFDSDACFTLPGPSPSPSAEDDDAFPKDIKGLTGRYRADSYSGGVWKDISGEGNDVDVDGELKSTAGSLTGTHETSMRFPKECMGEDGVYTLAYVGKYHGDKRGRIFDGSDVNWLSGWHANRAGVAHHGAGAWVGGDPPVNFSGQALLMGVDQKNLFRLNGVDKTKPGYSGGEAPAQITINDGMAKAGNWSGDGEVSDFLLKEVLIYNRELSTGEIKKIEEYLKKHIPELPTGTVVAKGYERVSPHVNEEPWYEYSGNQEACRLMAKEKGYVAWGHRNETHPQVDWRNKCFFYKEIKSFEDDTGDTVHTVGCADPSKDPHEGC